MSSFKPIWLAHLYFLHPQQFFVQGLPMGSGPFGTQQGKQFFMRRGSLQACSGNRYSVLLRLNFHQFEQFSFICLCQITQPVRHNTFVGNLRFKKTALNQSGTSVDYGSVRDSGHQADADGRKLVQFIFYQESEQFFFFGFQEGQSC